MLCVMLCDGLGDISMEGCILSNIRYLFWTAIRYQDESLGFQLVPNYARTHGESMQAVPEG